MKSEQIQKLKKIQKNTYENYKWTYFHFLTPRFKFFLFHFLCTWHQNMKSTFLYMLWTGCALQEVRVSTTGFHLESWAFLWVLHIKIEIQSLNTQLKPCMNMYTYRRRAVLASLWQTGESLFVPRHCNYWGSQRGISLPESHEYNHGLDGNSLSTSAYPKHLPSCHRTTAPTGQRKRPRAQKKKKKS